MSLLVQERVNNSLKSCGSKTCSFGDTLWNKIMGLSDNSLTLNAIIKLLLTPLDWSPIIRYLKIEVNYLEKQQTMYYQVLLGTTKVYQIQFYLIICIACGKQLVIRSCILVEAENIKQDYYMKNIHIYKKYFNILS